jgi:hypothetical protein
MKRIFIFFQLLFLLNVAAAQERKHAVRFEQLGTMLPTPNTYRAASGAPGHQYWQQKADYEIEVELHDDTQSIAGNVVITYTNNSPDPLTYLWIQLDQNVRHPDSDTYKTTTSRMQPSMTKEQIQKISGYAFEGGYQIYHVKDKKGRDLPYTINKTMMRLDLPEPLLTGKSFSFSLSWSFNINDRMLMGGRSGYEYFPEDGNYLYTIAQFFPRMAVYNDTDGWQNKQFLDRGEFALSFGDYKVKITVPSDHIVTATGVLQNPKQVLGPEQIKRLEVARKSDKPVMVITQKEAEIREKSRKKDKKTWEFHAENVRDFAFASSRKFIWDAMGVNIAGNEVMAMSLYPKEGNPLWERFATRVVAHTLKFYSDYTVPYTYPVAIAVHADAIGMEYPMISFNFGRPARDGSYTDRIKYAMIGVIIHEVGHNFFPMIINSDERQWSWMDEGLNSFVQYLAEQSFEPGFPSRRGPAASIIPYMKSAKHLQEPIMTNSENIIKFGDNVYGKPAAALNILRETIMGRELFDYAFKEYARRWAFKHPTPADFFRTMEDASGVDLDWFWRGWFFTTDHVDISIDHVRWFRLEEDGIVEERQRKKGDKIGKAKRITKIESEREKPLDKDDEEISPLTEFETFQVVPMPGVDFKKYMASLTDEDRRRMKAGANFYEVTFSNIGGLVMPLIVEFTFEDGTKEVERLPAEIWRLNELQVSKVFVKEKKVTQIILDPFLETADTDVENNYYPR